MGGRRVAYVLSVLLLSFGGAATYVASVVVPGGLAYACAILLFSGYSIGSFPCRRINVIARWSLQRP